MASINLVSASPKTPSTTMSQGNQKETSNNSSPDSAKVTTRPLGGAVRQMEDKPGVEQLAGAQPYAKGNDDIPTATSPSKSAPSGQPATSDSHTKKATLGFRNILYEGFPEGGVFRMAEQLFGWKRDGDASRTSPARTPVKVIKNRSDVAEVIWAPISSKEHMIQFVMRDETTLAFVGFKDSDQVPIQRHVRHLWNMEVTMSKRSTRGWHWGTYEFLGDNFVFNVNNEAAMYISAKNLKGIAQNPGKAKNELHLTLEDEDKVPYQQDSISEVKFHVIPEPEEEEKKEGEDKNVAALEYLYSSLLAKSNLTSATASKVAFILEYMNLASPPGRFDIHVVRDGIKLYGKSGNFSVSWSDVQGMYHLETKPNPYIFLALKQALRKGQTSYKHIVIHLDDRKQREISLNLEEDGPTDKHLIEEYKLQPMLKNEEKKIVPKLLAIYGSKKPQRSVIKDRTAEKSDAMPAIECSFRQQLGTLSFFSNCVIFAPKPPTLFDHSEIAVVDFRSPSARTRRITFRILMKAPRGSTPAEHSMESIDRQQLDMIIRYFTDHGVKTRTGTLEEAGEKETADLVHIPGIAEDEESSDESFEDKGADSSDRGLSDLSSDDGSDNGAEKGTH